MRSETIRTELSEPVPRDERRADELTQELGEFSYVVAHDLGASFRHVAEFSKMLLADMGDNVTPKQRLYAGHIRASTIRCQALIEQVHVYASIHQRDLQLNVCDASQLMEAARLHLHANQSEAKAQISIEPLGFVHGDATLLGLAFRHILHNALKFHEADAAPRITISAHAAEGVWTLRVLDNGIGVPTAHRAAAFRIFSQLDPQRFVGGVGAGLSISRAIARRHHGDARFVDCAQGACLEMVLPAIAAAEDSGALPASERRGASQ